MPTNPRIKNIIASGISFPQITPNTTEALDTIISSLNQTLLRPLQLSPGSGRTWNVSGNNPTNTVATFNRLTPPVGSSLPTVSSFTFTFPSAPAGTVTSTITIAAGATVPSITASHFVKVGVAVTNSGQLALTYGTSAASVAAAGVPAVTSDAYNIGYVVIQNNAGTLSNAAAGDRYQYDPILISSAVSGIVSPGNGGTGVSNGGTLTYGANNITFTTSGTTSLTLPTTGTVTVTTATTTADRVPKFLNTAGGLTQSGLSIDSSNNVTGVVDLTGSGNSNFGAFVSGAGSNTSPSYRFTGDADTGMYQAAADTINFATGGTLRLSVSTSEVVSTLPVRVGNGSVTAPSLAFSASTNTGLFSGATGAIALSAGAKTVIDVSAARQIILGPTANADSVTDPVTIYVQDSGTTSGLIIQGTSTSGNSGRLTWRDSWGGGDGGGTRSQLVGDVPASNKGRLTFYLRDGAGSAVTSIGNANSVGGTTPIWNLGINSDTYNRITSNAGTANRPCLQIWHQNNASDNAPLLISKVRSNTAASANYIWFEQNNTTGAPGTGGGNGAIVGNGAGAAQFGSFSDSRLKENITNIPNQLEKILALRPVEFDYLAGGHQVGFVAQEIQTIYPDTVSEGTNGYLMLVGWDKTSARLVKAIQELSAKLDAAEARIAALESP